MPMLLDIDGCLGQYQWPQPKDHSDVQTSQHPL